MPDDHRTDSSANLTATRPWRTRLLSSAVLCLLLALLAFAWKRQRELHWREKHYAPLVHETATRHGLAPALVMAMVWRESRFRPLCRGSKGELGLMQLMPGAVQDWSVCHRTPPPPRSQLLLPEVNLEIGCWYLAQARKHWQDYASWEILTLAEYNAGFSRVDKFWKPDDKAQTLSPQVISFPGTRDYIISILRKRKKYEAKRYSAT